MNQRLSELPKASLRIASCERSVRIDNDPKDRLQRYLTISGSPDGFRWLAQHLLSMADAADTLEDENWSEDHGAPARGCGNVVAPWDFANRPIDLENWDAIDFSCQSRDRRTSDET